MVALALFGKVAVWTLAKSFHTMGKQATIMPLPKLLFRPICCHDCHGRPLF